MTVGAVILCGGESRRMGQSKAWLPFGSERMLGRVVRLVSTVAGPLVIVAAPGQELPPLPASVLVAHDPVRGRGPLQGLAAGLAALPDHVELAYATATDVPFLQPAWIRRLISLIGDHDLAIPQCDGYHHPLAALYRRATALPAIDSLLQDDRLRPVFLMEVLRTRIVTADELREADPELLTLRNLNTPEDYRAALVQAGLSALEPATVENRPHLPRVQVELFGVPRLRAGVGRLAIEAANLGEALRVLARDRPALVDSVLTSEGMLHPAYTVNLNGDRFTTDPSTPLLDGDSLILLTVDVGG
jgi:molybdopterin-guanine dinucleotide biosynthesis protein A